MLSVILVETEHGQNLGAVCRVIANFGFDKLVLINPKCSTDDIDALIRAKHEALPILKNAKITDFSILDEFDYLIGTTARNGSPYNLQRSPMTPEEMAQLLEEEGLLKDPKINVGLLIGREGHGLFNEELKKCDYVVTIPTHYKYVTMNVSHAVAVLLYELYKKKGTRKMQDRFLKASAKEKEIILKNLDIVLAKTDFGTEGRKETQRMVWKRMIGKAVLTKREAFALIGFLKKMHEGK